MSLFFNERIVEEQKKEEDPLKDTITFTYPWIITVPPPDENDGQNREVLHVFAGSFRTTYLFGSETWTMRLIRDKIRIGTFYGINYDGGDDGPVYYKVWYGSCNLSYKLYYDNDMRFMFYSSPPIQMKDTNKDAFKTPDGFLKKMAEAFDQRKIAKIVVSIELHLPVKHFDRPFEKPYCFDGKLCDSYPSTMENDFRLVSFKKSDYTIKCPDGTVPCCRIILNVASEFFKKRFDTSEDEHELTVEHSIDVVKPIVFFLRTFCFEIPKLYDLDFAKRLFVAIKFFDLHHEDIIKASIELSLCKKFVHEYHDFDSILQWTSFVCQHSLEFLDDMVITLIATKYYFKWHQTFPENAQNIENPLYLHVFGSEQQWIFRRVDEIFKKSFLTNVILP